MKTQVGARPNKYWPIVAGVAVAGLFGYLILSNQKHATQSGDNIHKFANGGSYCDGSKRINYNKNNSLAYGNASSPGMLVPILFAIGGLYAFLWFNRDEDPCGRNCGGACTSEFRRPPIL